MIIIFINGCSSTKNDLNTKISDTNFSYNMSFEEFQIRLEEYAKNSPYPNIDD